MLPKTLASLAAAGFDKPRLFVDGSNDLDSWQQQFPTLQITTRFPKVRTHGNWILSLYELYIREPNAQRYAIFQDDMVASLNLRAYLDRCQYPDKGYWNCLTAWDNEPIIKGKASGWHESKSFSGDRQTGRGAQALVFDRQAVTTLLGSAHMIARPQDVNRGWKSVDGGIVSAMNAAGYREFIHNPSLIQHTGKQSSMGNKHHPPAATFRGEQFNLLEVLP